MQPVSRMEDGRWVDAEPSRYFSGVVEFNPPPRPVTPYAASTPAGPGEQMLLLKNYEGDQLSELLSQLPIKLPDELIEKIALESKDPRKINTNKINALRLRTEFLSVHRDDILNFNQTLVKYFKMIQKNELDLDFPFRISGSPFFVAFVEERCIEMAKRTYKRLNEMRAGGGGWGEKHAVVTERQLNDLRNVMLLSFARPRIINNDLRLKGELKDEGLIDNIYCSIERVATLCFVAIDTSTTPWDELTANIAFSLLDNCCDHLIYMNTLGVTGLTPDLKQKMADRAHRIRDRLNKFSQSEICFHENCQSRMHAMKKKLHDGIKLKREGPGGGSKSKNKSNKKINSNKNKNSRRKINKNSRRKINKNKKKTLRLRIKK